MKRRFTKLIAALALLLFVVPLGMWGQTRTEEVYSTCLFGSNYNSGGVQDYTSTWTTSNEDFTWTIVNGNNNNNGWSTVKFGRKNNASVGQIKTAAAYNTAISKIDLTIDAITTSKINSIKLYTSGNGSNWSEAGSFTKATGIQTVTLQSPAANLYYKIEFDCASGSSNGLVTISKVEYYHNAGAETPTITISDEQLILPYEENDNGTFSVSYTNFTPVYATAALYYDEECSQAFPTSSTDAWIVLDLDQYGNLVDPYDAIPFMVEENEASNSRPVYMKVEAMDDGDIAIEGVFTITQEGKPAPVPYINIVANHGETVENPYLIERPTWQNGGGFLREVEFGNFTVSGASDFQIMYCNANGEPIDETPAMFSGVQVDYYYYQYFQTYVYRLYVAVTNNNSTQDRSGYFKVWVNVNDTPFYSDLVTVHQPGKPQVATPTFNPAAGKVESGTTVAISCDTEGAAIQYSTDGTNYSEYTAPIVINEAMTLYAIATKQNHVDSEVATAQYTVKGDAVFENGVYYESMESQQSFDNMEAVSVVGDEQYWHFDSDEEAAYINGYKSGKVDNVDWLITPKMAVENGKLNVSFLIWHNHANNQLSLKWSNSNSIDNNEWTSLSFTEGSSNTSNFVHVDDIIIESNNPVYVAFVYDNTSASNAALYEVCRFTARQYYNVTFNANNTEATGTMTALSCAAGVATALTDNVFAVAGKVFNGWNTQPDGQGDAYADGADITITANTTLYAQWEDAYKVKFMTNGVEDVTVEVVQGQAIGTLPTANAAYIPSGYVFKGWLASEYQVSNVAPNEYINSAYEPDGDVTLYAVFAIPGETSYTLVGPSDVTEGTYIIGALKSTEATNNFYFATSTISSGAINVNASSTAIPETSGVRSIASLPSGAVEFTFTGNSTNGFTISTIISASTKYLGYTSYANNKLSFNTDYSTFTWKAVEKTNALVTNGVYLDNHTTNGHYYISENTTNDNCIRAYTNSSNIYRAIYLFKKAETSSTNYRTSLTENHTLSISGYADVTGINNTGYHFIASPVYVDPATVEGMTEGDYDLYYFDEAQDHEEWRNYEAGNFTFVPGTGYLYAKKATAATPTYNFTLEGAPYNGNGQVTLSKTNGTQFSGWNLIGNPYANPATLGTTAFYKMNSTGSELESVDVGTTIDAMEGVFVLAANDGDVVTFEEQTPNEPNSGSAVSQLSININKSRGGSIDRAIVRFDNGNQLPKFQLNPKHTKVYFQQDNKDYAVVRSANEGEMPVSFKAETRGTYTLSVNTENVEMSYLHLIDNMTGADVDLLATPSYTFEAKTSDYASRFRLVFSVSFISEDADGDSAFAYFNGSNWTISNMGEATLQVVDVMGRVLSSETLSGNAEVNINQPTGVYMLRLVSGDSVKVQKVVVR